MDSLTSDQVDDGACALHRSDDDKARVKGMASERENWRREVVSVEELIVRLAVELEGSVDGSGDEAGNGFAAVVEVSCCSSSLSCRLQRGRATGLTSGTGVRSSPTIGEEGPRV